MSQGIRRPFEAVDFEAVQRLYPPPPEYFESAWLDDPETIERKQLTRLQHRAHQAYRVPFLRRRWDDAGFHPKDLRTLDDLWHVPSYTIDDIRRNIAEHPPWGDYQGVDPANAALEPQRVFMSGGTTGTPRPTLYTAWDRSVGTLLLSRVLYMCGVRPGDTVLNNWSYSLHNGAFVFEEAAYNWLNCIVLTASTGNVTSTRTQAELIRDYKVNAVFGTGDYMRRIVVAAEELGFDIERDFALTAMTSFGDEAPTDRFPHLPQRRYYGFHELIVCSVECPAGDGLHIFEDACTIQIIDVDTGAPVPDGTLGAVVATEFWKTGSPQFRYNVQDLSYLYPRERCACGSWLRRMAPFNGRGDNMVKLRGLNIWPESVGECAAELPHVELDYFVRVVRIGARDEMIVTVASTAEPARFDDVREQIEQHLRRKFELRIGVEVVRPGELDVLTEARTANKPRRFRDERPRAGATAAMAATT